MTQNVESADATSDELLRARAAALAVPLDEAAEARETVDLVPFTAAGQPYAIAAAAVGEVRPLIGVSRLPRAPAALVGMSRVRSTVVALFDLPVLLGRSTRPPDPPRGWVVVVDDGTSARMGLVAEEVGAVRACTAADIRPVTDGNGADEGLLGVTAEGVAVVDPAFLMSQPAAYPDGRPGAADGTGSAPFTPEASTFGGEG